MPVHLFSITDGAGCVKLHDYPVIKRMRLSAISGHKFIFENQLSQFGAVCLTFHLSLHIFERPSRTVLLIWH